MDVEVNEGGIQMTTCTKGSDHMASICEQLKSLIELGRKRLSSSETMVSDCDKIH